MNKGLKIAVIAPPWNQVPPLNYGGTEQIVDILCRGYQQAGHHPVLFASGDSTCPVQRHTFIAKAEMPPDKYKEHIHLAGFLSSIDGFQFDIVHTHLEGFIPYAKLIEAPVVCTVHVEITPERLWFLEQHDSVHVVALSQNHASTFPCRTTVINHGLELGGFPYVADKEHYLFFIGELSERKGVDIAARTARELGIPLKIAGYLRPEKKLWFEEEVLGLGSGREIEYLGLISHEDKLHFMSHARATLCPVTWEEPFGLVAIESLACGTPVVAMARGAFPELVEHGVSGFLCRSEEEFIDGVSKTKDLESARCRSIAEARFSHERMVKEYLGMFTCAINPE
jgi:glycosyltransferase involved in cell wall biosynthesis